MIQIRHRVGGRMRLSIASLYRNPPMGRHLERHLSAADGVFRARSNILCGSLVVLYNPKRLAPERLARNIAALLGERLTEEPILRPSTPLLAGMVSALPFVPSTGPAKPAHGSTPEDCAACDPAASPENGKIIWIERIGTFVLLTGHLGYLLVREYVYKRPLPQSPLEPDRHRLPARRLSPIEKRVERDL